AALRVRGRALDRLDQVRDEVVPALLLDLDLRVRVVDPVPRLDQAVVGEDQEEDQQDDDDGDDDADDHETMLPGLLRLAKPSAQVVEAVGEGDEQTLVEIWVARR